MKQTIGTKHLYSILFWAYPKSGFDVAKKNLIKGMLEQVMHKATHLNSILPIKLNNSQSNNNGFVIYDEVVESNTEIIDAEAEVMPTIRERYPEAKFASINPVSIP